MYMYACMGVGVVGVCVGGEGCLLLHLNLHLHLPVPVCLYVFMYVHISFSASQNQPVELSVFIRSAHAEYQTMLHLG